MSEMDRYEGPRGFVGFGKFKSDRHGEIYVQESSAAYEGPKVWVRAELSYSNAPEKNAPVLHLSLADAKKLRKLLTRFIVDAEADRLTEPMANIPEEEL